MKEKANRSDRGAHTSLLTFLICVAILVGAVLVASLVQRDFGRIEVTNLTYENDNGIPLRAKLLRPVDAT